MRKGFVIHHNGPPANCLGQPHSRCESFWAAVKAYHTNPVPAGKGWSDIAYSFGVCPHGTRFVGRGWDKNQWANGSDQVGHDDGSDSEWYTVLAFVGGDDSTHDEELPTNSMVANIGNLIEEGRATSRCGKRVLPHSDFKQKPCPGPTFTTLARAWDNQPINSAPEKEDDMLIIDCKGKPALVLGLGNGVMRIDTAQRNALVSIGVEAKQVDAATSDALYSLHDD